jgi:branched-chain amino acid transport system substrate-binding protein
MGNRFLLVLGVILAFTLLAFANCIPAAEKMVKIGELIDLTGPTSDAGQEMHQAYVDNVRWLNEEEGGFNGIKADLLWSDTSYQIPRTLSGYKRSKEQGAIAFFVWSAGDCEALKPSLERDRIPVLTSGASPTTLYPPGWVYTSMTAYADNFAGTMKWFKQTWKESRPVKVALLGFDNAFGRSPSVAARKYARENNVEIAAELYFSPAAMDFTTEMTKVKDVGADYAYISASQIPVAGILRDAQKLGILGKVKFIHGTSSSPLHVYRLAGPLTEGLLFANDQAVPTEDNVPAIKRIKEMHLKYRGTPLAEAENVYTQTWIRSQLMFEGIRRAVNKVGYDGLSGASIKEGLDSIKDFDLMGVAPKMSYGPGDPRAQEYIRMVEYRGGKLVPVSDWIYCDFVKPE